MVLREMTKLISSPHGIDTLLKSMSSCSHLMDPIYILVVCEVFCVSGSSTQKEKEIFTEYWIFALLRQTFCPETYESYIIVLDENALNGNHQVYFWNQAMASGDRWRASNISLDGPVKRVSTLSFSPCATKLAIGNGTTMQIWDANPPKKLFKCNGSERF